MQSVNARKIDFPTSEADKASIQGKKKTSIQTDMRVKRLIKEQGERLDISRFPNFHKTGSVKGMKNLYYDKEALLVRCGNYIYNVTSKPSIYEQAK